MSQFCCCGRVVLQTGEAIPENVISTEKTDESQLVTHEHQGKELKTKQLWDNALTHCSGTASVF